VSKGDKLLERMRANPKGDWRIEDIEVLCRHFDIACEAPRRGSHYTVSHETQAEIVTVPFKRPIKPVYIRELVRFVDAVEAARANAESKDG